MSTSCAHLPRGYHTIHNGCDNDRPIDRIQSTIHRWIETVKISSNSQAASTASLFEQFLAKYLLLPCGSLD
eukprot:15352885-Ditylum_brightwellii.AAC.1